MDISIFVWVRGSRIRELIFEVLMHGVEVTFVSLRHDRTCSPKLCFSAFAELQIIGCFMSSCFF